MDLIRLAGAYDEDLSGPTARLRLRIPKIHRQQQATTGKKRTIEISSHRITAEHGKQ